MAPSADFDGDSLYGLSYYVDQAKKAKIKQRRWFNNLSLKNKVLFRKAGRLLN